MYVVEGKEAKKRLGKKKKEKKKKNQKKQKGVGVLYSMILCT